MLKKKCFRFDIILKLKTIHGRTYRNKTKKNPRWRKLRLKSLLLQGRRGNNFMIVINQVLVPLSKVC